MDILTLLISTETFARLINDGHLSTKECETKIVEPDNFEYYGEEWEKAKSISNKAYAKLKEIEFKQRNK